MPHFHPLTVTDIRATTHDAVIVRLRPDDPAAFAFTPGQYLTLRRMFGATEIRRSYSISSAPGDILEVGIKHVPGGAFSGWANTEMQPGDRIKALAPAGRFRITEAPDRPGHYLAVAAGSGITPILSILRAGLATMPNARFTLVFANRAANSIMYREALEDLKNLHMGRLNILHILKNTADEIDLFTGRIDAAKCTGLFRHWIDIASVDQALICGPEGMMETVRQALLDHGLAQDRIVYELFTGTQSGLLEKVTHAQAAIADDTISATIITGGTALTIPVRPGQSLLQAALAAEIDAPYSCQAGVCSTCRARITEGSGAMQVNHALEDYEVDQGYVLSCQCYPTSRHVTLDYDV